MDRLKGEQIERMVQPYLAGGTLPPRVYTQLEQYLDLLLRWNARTNLTSIRDPAEIVLRHFGESVFTAQQIGSCTTLLDFGSGAGFPGVPIQLVRPDLNITLAESQNKKASFLREVIRSLGLPTQVWGGRVEMMPEARKFDVVTLRAVDRMEITAISASRRASRQLTVLTTLPHTVPAIAEFEVEVSLPIPETIQGRLVNFRRKE